MLSVSSFIPSQGLCNRPSVCLTTCTAQTTLPFDTNLDHMCTSTSDEFEDGFDRTHGGWDMLQIPAEF